LLRKDDIINKIDELTADSIARILKVDAVIKCAYSYVKTSTEGAAIAKTVLFGGVGSKTASGTLAMQIKNGSDGELLWRFSKKMDETAFCRFRIMLSRPEIACHSNYSRHGEKEEKVPAIRNQPQPL